MAEGATTVIKSNEEGAPTIGTFSAPTAKNANGGTIPATAVVSPLAELTIDSDTNAQEITFSYHPAP
ncbi:Uncharacterised protein [Mycobacteroides abscessus subsp. abscessus]|nr:Uncharacterised protein [Mycobacteroides abscessus subsp. abscessus]